MTKRDKNPDDKDRLRDLADKENEKNNDPYDRDDEDRNPIDGAPAVNPFPPNLDPSQYNPLTNPGKIVDDELKEKDETR